MLKLNSHYVVKQCLGEAFYELPLPSISEVKADIVDPKSLANACLAIAYRVAVGNRLHPPTLGCSSEKHKVPPLHQGFRPLT